jgi:homoserine O-acetyltransferase/O-succinyltransferase
MARLVRQIVDGLGVHRVKLATGGSLGGMVALEWAATFRELTDRTVVFAAPARHPAAAVGWNHIQRKMVELAGDRGLELARMVAMMTYRTAEEFDVRFGRQRREDGTFLVESYLSRHGQKLLARFDVHSYLALIDAMDSHDVGERRGGVEAALEGLGDRLVGVGIPGDILYREEDVLQWVRPIGATYRQIHSIRGHDAFLLESDQVSAIFREALDAPVTELAAVNSCEK